VPLVVPPPDPELRRKQEAEAVKFDKILRQAK
jgi:hypothetical protein